ncbi:hypothetical protein GH714_030257 [Hevea brasiliensis]|uniref:Uncharacterized protein n=1 Tax=Hevea brasiliensis TaxID=3981 RepID=A0A6A6LKG0_HEVBR|nr:hypothetical protein GH714_030257 [Hevea brasiliensis]
MPIETSLSSIPLTSQITSEETRKWHIPGFPLGNSVCAGPSTSGIEDMHPPLSSMKGSSAQASPLLSQNGGTLKDAEILESRPMKVRRKMFDLQLPANEYIDTEEGEQLRDENVCGISSYLPNRNHKVAAGSGINVLVGTGGKNNCQGDELQYESCLKRKKNNLADLNEPILVEDTNTSANNRLGFTSLHCEIQGHELAAKPKSQFIGLPKEILLNSHHGSGNETANDLHLQNNVNGKLWFPHMLDSGNSKYNLKSVSLGLQPEKLPPSSQPIQVLLNKTNEPATLFHTVQSKVDQLRERTGHGLEPSGRNNEVSNNNHPVSVASHIPSQYAIDPSSDLSNSWSRSISSWEKPSGSLSQKSMSVQMHPYFNSSATLSSISQSSTQTHGVFGERWNYNSSSASNLRIGSELPDQNGFYHGSSSGSKELLVRFPSGNCDYLNCSSASDAAHGNFINHGSSKLYKSSNCMDSKSAKDVNLNVVLSNSSSTKMDSQRGLEVIDLERNHEDHLVALPWLRTKPSHKAEANSAGVDLNTEGLSDLQSSLNQLSDKSEAGKFRNQTVVQNLKSAACSNVAEAGRIETSDSSSCRKIFGFPISEKPHISKIESSSLTSPCVSLPQPSEEAATEVLLIEKEIDTQVANVRHEIDLNSCITEDESSLKPSLPGSNVKIISGIDLEAPAVPETEDDMIPGEGCLEKAHEAPSQLSQHNAESLPDEFVRIAAESLVAISLTGHGNHRDDASCTQSETSATDLLHWFVDIVSSFGEDLESKLAVLGAEEDGQDNEGSSLEDYFESMTLKLTETKEEDYMPKPLVPEDLKLEETGTTLLPTRTRKGHARRGRQRRDFQRDILPGLASLSRHEVTEDLQTFGGLMRATGHPWHSGLTRRNTTRSGCGRGRRRALVSSPPAVIANPTCTPLIQQLNNVEVGLEDRSLTGWGKTTRRPRRQRCPPGNPPALALT